MALVSSPMCLAFFEEYHAIALQELIEREDLHPSHVIRLDSGVEQPATLPGASLLTFESVLPFEKRVAVECQATALAREWYVQDGRDATIFNHISLGVAVEYSLKVWLACIFKLFALMDSLSPACVVFVDSGDWASNAIMMWCQAHADITSVVTIRRGGEKSAEGLTDWTKQPSRKAAVALWMLRQVKRLTRSAPDPRLPLVLAEWYPTMAGHYRDMVKARQARVIFLKPIPDLWLMLRNRCSVVDPRESVGPTCADPALCDVMASAVMTGQVFNSWPATVSGVRLSSLLWRTYGTSLIRLWHECGHRALSLQRIIERIGPDAIIVAQDAQGTSRLLVQMARTARVPTLLATHGIPTADPGMYPAPITDAAIAWGPDQRRFLEAEGITADRTCVAGNSNASVKPAMFPQVRRLLTHVRWRIRGNNKPVVLFAADTSGLSLALSTPTEENDLLRRLCAIYAGSNQQALVVRFHPSTSAYEPLDVKRQIVARYGRGRVAIDPGVPLRNALLAADVVLVTESTVAIEALRLGRPVVQLDLHARPIRMQLPGDIVPRVRDERLIPTVVEAARQEWIRERCAWQGRVDTYLAQQLGPHPWVTEPIIDLIQRLSTGEPSPAMSGMPSCAPMRRGTT